MKSEFSVNQKLFCWWRVFWNNASSFNHFAVVLILSRSSASLRWHTITTIGNYLCLNIPLQYCPKKFALEGIDLFQPLHRSRGRNKLLDKLEELKIRLNKSRGGLEKNRLKKTNPKRIRSWWIFSVQKLRDKVCFFHEIREKVKHHKSSYKSFVNVWLLFPRLFILLTQSQQN